MIDFRNWAERIGEHYITEREFISITEARRAQLAEDIKASGLSFNHIGKGTRLGRKTIARAANGLEVRQEADDRIRYYLEKVARPEHTVNFSPTKSYDGQTIETK